MKEVPQFLLNYILNTTWNIDLQWGISEFNKVLFNLENKVDATKIRSLNLPIYHSIGGSTTKITDHKEKVIAEFSLSGVMITEGGACSFGVRDLSNKIYKAYNNAQIDGILLNANTGGGEGTAGELLLSTIQDRNKPLVTVTGFLGSAGVHGTADSDEIIALSESSQIGSIGSYLSIDKKLMADYKKNIETIYAKSSNLKNKAIRQYLAGDTSALEEYVEKSAKHFQKDMLKFRNITDVEADRARVLGGEVFYAKEAKKFGLIDSINTKNYAMKRLKSYINKN